MSGKALTIAVILKAIDNLTGPLRQVAGALKDVDDVAAHAEGMKKMGGDMRQLGLEMVAGSAAITAALAVPAHAFEQLEDAQTRAQIAFMTTSGIDKSFDRISSTAIDLGNRLPGTTRDFMELAAAMKESGLSGEAIANGGLEAAAYLKVLVPSLSAPAKVIANMRQNLGVAQGDLVTFVDLLQRAKFGTGLDPEQFASYAVPYIGQPMKDLGMSGLGAAKDVLVLAGALSQAGIDGSRMGTGLKEILLRTALLGTHMKGAAVGMEVLERHGIALQFFKGGSFVGLEGMLKQLDKLKVLSQQERMQVLEKLFGSEATPMLGALLEKGPSGFADAKKALDAQASMSTRIGLVLGTLKSVKESALGTVENMLAAIGGALGPDLKSLANSLNAVSASVGDWASNHQTLLKWLARTLAVVAAVLAVLGTLTFVVGTLVVWLGLSYATWAAWAFVLPKIYALVVSLTGAVIDFGLALLATPIGWAVAIAAAIVAVGYAIYHYRSQIGGFFQSIAGWASSAASRMYAAGANLISMLWEGMKSMASRPVQLIRQIAQSIRNHLPFSPAKEGPLRDLHRIKLIETIAGTMHAAPMVNAMRAAAAASLIAVSSPGAARAIPVARAAAAARPIQFTFSPTVTVKGAVDPAAVKAQVLSALREYAPELERQVRAQMEQLARGTFTDRAR